jgi:hypothetical protein
MEAIMRITSVSFGFTKNLGNYESMRVDATVELLEDESFDGALQLASGVVNEALDRSTTAGEHILLAAERRRVSIAQGSKP